MFAAIDVRMTEFLQANLGLTRLEADAMRRDYWLRYGATLVGLTRHHRVIDPQRFLDETHDFDIAALLRAERGLAHLGRQLPGRKVLLTNAPARYAGEVLRGIGLHRHITTRYAVENMRVHGHYRPKPALSMFRAIRVRERMGGRTARERPILVDDNAANLKAARAAGFATVMFVRRSTAGPGRIRGAGYVDARVRSVHQLSALTARLRAPRSG